MAVVAVGSNDSVVHGVSTSIPPPLQRAWRLAVGRVRIDARSLAAFRILVGLLAIADVALRARNFSVFYAESGAVPQSLAEASTHESAISVYYFTTDPTVVAGLFVLQALVGLQLVVGYRSRIATVLTFVLVVSMDHHNPFVLSYADILFRLLLFWAIFLPLGERWSIDAVHAKREPRQSFVGVASLLILLQMVVMYFVNGLHKAQEELWRSGEATPLIMGLDNTTFFLGEVVRAAPTLLQVGGLTWYYMLLASPLLFVLWGRPRTFFVAMFLGGHASFAVTVRIGAFAYVAIAGLLLFLPAQFWRDGERLLRRLGADGSRYERARSLASSLARRLPRLRPDGSTQRRAREVTYTVAVGIVLGSIVIAGGGALAQAGGVVEEPVGPEEGIERAANSVGVWQPDWSIFAPTPRTTDRYYVFPAETADGELLDVYNERELTYDRPDGQLQRQYGTYRERFYMGSLRDVDGAVADELATHLCETYETDDGGRLTHLNTYAVDEEITRETIDDPERRDRTEHLLTRHGCGDAEPTSIHPP